MSEQHQPSLRYTPNQVVAYNLRQARVLRGWTQEEAAERLAPHLGEKWSAASYSLAERSTERPERVRHFSADDITAFCLTFELPILWFFFPPEAGAVGRDFRIAPPQVPIERAHQPGLFVELIFGRPETHARLADRLHKLWKDHPAQEEGRFMRLLDKVSQLASRSSIQHVVWNITQRSQGLRDLAAMLDESASSTASTMESALNRLVDDYYGELLDSDPEPELKSDAGTR